MLGLALAGNGGVSLNEMANSIRHPQFGEEGSA